jgi:hypothetical protein
MNKNILFSEHEYKRDTCLDIHEALLEKLHKYEKWPFLVYGLPDGSKRREQHKHGGYIIFIKAVKVVEQVRSQLTQLKTTAGWNSRAYVVIVVMSDLNYSFGRVSAEDILAEFWSEKIVNTAVLLPASDCSKLRFQNPVEGAENMELVALQEVYVYFPYQATNKCGNITHASLLDYWVKSDSLEGRFLRNVPLFPSKIPPDLHGCTLSVSTFELEPVIMKRKSAYDDGLEIRLLNTILSYLNLSAVFLPPPPKNERWGRHLPNGSWDGIIGSVAQRRSDVAVGGIVVHNMTEDSVDVTFSYLEQGINWYVPCAKALPHRMNITSVFTTILWLGIILMYIIVSSLIWYLYKSRWKSSEFFQNMSQSFIICLLNLWAVMLGISASLHIPNSATIRMLYILLIFYSLGLNTVYQALLTTYLVEPRLEKQISTEEQLLQSGLELGINPHFEQSGKGMFRSQYPNMIPCPDTEECLRRLAEKGDLAVLCAERVGEYMGMFKFPDSNGKPAYCKLYEQFTTLNMAMCMQKGDPLLYYFNKVIMHVFETGLLNHWWNDLKHNATLSSKKIFLTIPTMEFKTLTVYHLQSCFYALCLGHVLSLGLFICEVITQFHGKA